MKKYVKPEIIIHTFDSEDIIQTSGQEIYTRLLEYVAGRKGIDYGAQSVSIYDE